MTDRDSKAQEALVQLEATLQAMQWDEVSLSPDTAFFQAIEQGLPGEWTRHMAEREFTPEELEALLHAPIDVPEGDIDQNALQALQELDIDVEKIFAELDTELDRDQAPLAQDHDVDFDR